MSVAELEAAFAREVASNKRVAAETAYVLALRYQTEYVEVDQPQVELARVWAQRAIDLLDSLPSESAEQVVSTRQWVGGVPLPDLLHSGVVRGRFADLLGNRYPTKDGPDR